MTIIHWVAYIYTSSIIGNLEFMSERKTRTSASAPTIGFITTAVEGIYDNMLLSGISDTIQEAGATLLCFVGNRLSSAADFEEQGQQIFELASHNIDGLIVNDGISKENSKETIAHFLQQQAPLPTITFAFQINNYPYVKTDNSSGIHDAVNHLVRRHGCRRIAYIGGPKTHQDAIERYAAYCDSLAEHNIPLNMDLVTTGNFYFASGREAMQTLLERNVAIDAVMAANDYMALGAWHVLEKTSIKVPEDIAVVGFDNIVRNRMPQYPLTTIDQPFYQRSRSAALAMLDLLQGKPVPTEISIPTELVIRKSCGCSTEGTFEYKIDHHHKPEKIEPEQVIARMVRAAHPAPVSQATPWCQTLYHSFIHDLSEPQTQTFLPALLKILEESVYFGGDAKIWHAVLSVLKDSISSSLDEVQNVSQAENLWYQARIQIGLTMAEIEARLRTNRTEEVELLRNLDADFWRTSELPQLFAVMYAQCPRLGVKSLYLALYDGTPSTAQARLMFAYNQTGIIALPEEGKRFRSQDLLPDHLLSQHAGSTLIIEHFYFKTHSLGFVVFEVEDVKTAVCDNLSRQIGQNIQRILTMQKQQATQEQLDERTEELQQQKEILAKRAEELEEAHTFLDTIIEHIPNALFVKDARDLTYLRWNKATEALFGNSYDELMSKNVFDIATSLERAQKITELDRQVLEQGKLVEIPEFEMYDTAEQIHIVHSQHVPIFGVDGNPKYLLNILQDITERKKLEQRIQSALERRTRYVEISIEVAQQIAAAPSMDELFHRVVHLIRERFGYYHTQVYTLKGQELILQAGTGDAGAQLKSINHRIALIDDNRLAARAARTGETMMVPNVYNEPGWIPNPLMAETRSEIAVPIKLGDQILGVLTVQNNQTDSLDDEDQFLLRHLCGQIAIAIDYRRTETERLKAEIKALQRRAMLEKVVRMGQSVTQVADLQECLLRIYKIVKDNLGFDRVGLHLYDASKHALLGTYGTDRNGFQVEEWDKVMFIDENDSIRQLLLEPDRLLYTQNYDVEGVAYFTGEMVNVKDHASIASWAGDKPVAMLHVDNLVSQRPFTEEQLEGLRFFSGYVGLAIENARLLEQVRDAEQRYRSIFENAVEGIFQFNPEGHFLSANPAMAHMLGYPSPTTLISSITDVRTQIFADPNQQDYLWQKLAQSGSVQGFEFQVRRQDGSLAWLSQNILIVYDGQGEILYLEGTVQDVTKRKEIETERESLIKELEMRNAELERFTYTVSHDLKSPLITIQGFMGFVEKDALAGNVESLKGDILRINEAARQMYILLDDLLELSRIGRVVNSPEMISLDSLIQEAVLLVSGQIDARGVQVVVASDLPAVYGDYRRLLEVVQNLLDNAVKFMGQQPEPRIEIGAEPVDGMILCYVRDNGIGIQPQYHEKVFGLFERLNQSIDGSGIGLALVKRIIEIHNGRIWVESNGENPGTSLYFTVPSGNTGIG